MFQYQVSLLGISEIRLSFLFVWPLFPPPPPPKILAKLMFDNTGNLVTCVQC